METNDTVTQVIKDSIKNILTIYDEPDREGLKDTPERVARMYDSLLYAEEPKITVFESKEYDAMIIDKDIAYYTFCEHHLLPFFGTVKIGYIPDGKIIGLSKLARIVDYYSKRLNTQEYFTKNIANYLMDKINPLGCGVIVEGRHLCREMRGIERRGNMITNIMYGVFKTNSITRQEFMTI